MRNSPDVTIQGTHFADIQRVEILGLWRPEVLGPELPNDLDSVAGDTILLKYILVILKGAVHPGEAVFL